VTRIKFCGLKREEDAKYISQIGCDYAGFILSAGFKRSVTPEQVVSIKRYLPEEVKTVGVFVDDDINYVIRMLSEGIIDIAQLHGHEDDVYIIAVKAMTGKPVIKMFKIRGPEDIVRAKMSPADYVLLDSGTGGTGKVFDWSLAKNMGREFFLAGGLTPGNVRSAVSTLSPFAVDVSSGVETDGVKDFEKMKKFAEEVQIL